MKLHDLQDFTVGQIVEESKRVDKENEENDDFKVVMPEANKTTMPQEEFKEQPDYLKVFANFYIAEFDEDDLEVINLYDARAGTDARAIDLACRRDDHPPFNAAERRRMLVRLEP